MAVEGVHATARRIDRSMNTVNRALRKFGIPSGAAKSIEGLKNRVGDVLAELEMAERRS